MLTEYSRVFDTVELDNTFYGIPSKQTVLKWKGQTSDHFLFSAKFPKRISHEKMFINSESELSRFIDAISCLGEKLGPLLLQLQFQGKGKLTEQKISKNGQEK